MASMGPFLIHNSAGATNIAANQIAVHFSADVSAASNVIEFHMIAFSCLLLSGGRLADLWGATRAYRLGLAVFAAASGVAGLAPSIGILVAAQTLAGIGAAIIIPSSFALLTLECQRNPAGTAFAVAEWTALGSAAVALSPFMAGVVVDQFGWRATFFCSAGLSVGAYALVTVFVPCVSGANRPRIDLRDELLLVISLAGVILGLVQLSSAGWSHPMTILPLLVGVSAGLRAIQRARGFETRFHPATFLKNRLFMTAVFIGLITGMTYYAAVFGIGLYVQALKGYTATEAGLVLLPLSLGLALSNISSAALAARFGLRLPIVGGLVCSALGYLVFVESFSIDLGLASLAFVLFPIGLVGLTASAVNGVVIDAFRSHSTGTAIAIVSMTRQGGGALGVAILGSSLTQNWDITSEVLTGTFGVCAALLLIAALIGRLGVKLQRP